MYKTVSLEITNFKHLFCLIILVAVSQPILSWIVTQRTQCHNLSVVTITIASRASAALAVRGLDICVVNVANTPSKA